MRLVPDWMGLRIDHADRESVTVLRAQYDDVQACGCAPVGRRGWACLRMSALRSSWCGGVAGSVVVEL